MCHQQTVHCRQRVIFIGEKKSTIKTDSNDLYTELHREARNAFLSNRTNGKPHAGPFYAFMKSTRAKFKLALRQSRTDTTKKDADSLAQKLPLKDHKQFWNEIKKINSKEDYNAMANTVDGVSGGKAIAEKWRCYFEDLLESCWNLNAGILVII